MVMVEQSDTAATRWEHLQAVFLEALERPADQREAFLASRANGDAALLAEARRLLTGHSDADDGFLQPPIIAPADESREDSAALLHKRIGKYNILRVIGVGGMGVVYEAEQEHPKRTVALKVLRVEAVGRGALKRFKQEAEILARLRHEGIAQVYEAGVATIDGHEVPYLAMELIPQATVILDYAREKAMDVPQRLELMARVCDAVHHGHLRGVIHRDLKPANILVDGDGNPKVIDFGVARATIGDVAVTMATEPGLLVGTLQYMSPEQVEGAGADVDTRSDVYSLGVVLYELLGGRAPYDIPRSSIVRAAEVIRNDEPRRLGSLGPQLTGDIETIVHKAMEKKRDRRYESAAALATDIRRYLAHQPIEARPVTTIYQLRLFARRNRGLVAGVSVALAGMVLGTAAAIWQAVQATKAEQQASQDAQRARDAETTAAIEAKRAKDAELIAEAEARRAKDTVDGLLHVFRSMDASLAGYQTFSAQPGGTSDSLLQTWIALIDRQFESQPETQARLLDEIGFLYANDDLFDRAEAVTTHAADVRRAAFGENSVQYVDSLLSMASLQVGRERMTEATAIYLQAHELALATEGPEGNRTNATLHALRKTAMIAGDYELAERYARQCEEAARRTNTSGLYPAIANVGETVRERGRLAEAAGHFREALAMLRKSVAEDSPHVGGLLYQLAVTAVRMGDRALIEEVEREARAQQALTQTLPVTHPHQSGVRLLLGVLEMAKGNLTIAEEHLRACAALREEQWGKDQKLTAYARNVLGDCLLRQGKFEEAGPHLRESTPIIRRENGLHHAWSQEAYERMVRLCTAEGNAGEAATWQALMDEVKK